MPGVRFPSTEALRRLGIVDPGVFYPQPGAMTPTIQVADLSRTVTTEPIEARAFDTSFAAPVAGEFGIWEVTCRAAGGLIVEHFSLLTPSDGIEDPTNPALGCRIWIDETNLLSTAVPPFMDIGGIATKSFPMDGTSPTFPPAAETQQWFNVLNQTQSRIYVPAGAIFHAHARAANVRFQTLAVWRELQEIQPI